MKFYNIVVAAALALFFTGCDTEKKIDSIADNLEKLVGTTKGVSCENEEVLKLLKSIVDKKFNEALEKRCGGAFLHLAFLGSGAR